MSYCHHCYWLEKNNCKGSSPIWRDNQVTVFNACKKFQYTFNVVFQKCTSQDLPDLLQGVSKFIQYLDKVFDIQDVRVAVNSHVNHSKNVCEHGKEHLHAMVAMNSKASESKFRCFFFKNWIPHRLYIKDVPCTIINHLWGNIIKVEITLLSTITLSLVSQLIHKSAERESFYMLYVFKSGEIQSSLISY
jgi:hypothetical protein